MQRSIRHEVRQHSKERRLLTDVECRGWTQLNHDEDDNGCSADQHDDEIAYLLLLLINRPFAEFICHRWTCGRTRSHADSSL